MYYILRHLSIFWAIFSGLTAVRKEEIASLRDEVVSMFYHGYNSYMNHAYPADELKPLSCAGRYRGVDVSRGDLDDALGNFSLTLIDSMDTLALLGNFSEFERAVHLVLNVSFDTDIVVSVFETNIRVLGGLLGAHFMVEDLRRNRGLFKWYADELVDKAVDVADRLLVAFNTTTGLPYPKVNLHRGVFYPGSPLPLMTTTCTACAGTIIIEFGVLSLLTGNPVYERKARAAMDALWRYRSQQSDLVGTVIDVLTGQWERTDSGVGAGIDSYYEYVLKAYILFGDESYLERFHRHYNSVNQYVRQGSWLLDTLMHHPSRPVRHFADALQAFWPGLQVLLGDIQLAIEHHELHYLVAKLHHFIPEAFTTRLEVYWPESPLRPELAESTYFLYQATKDPYYLQAGKHILTTLQLYSRVECGFAAFKDVRTLTKDDRMDSFFLAETFKYLFLLFSEGSTQAIRIDEYLFTTEAHLIPLALPKMSSNGFSRMPDPSIKWSGKENSSSDDRFICKRGWLANKGAIFAQNVRSNLQHNKVCTSNSAPSRVSAVSRPASLLAVDFEPQNQDHHTIIRSMGIKIAIQEDGTMSIIHNAGLAISPDHAEQGFLFIQDLVKLSKERSSTSGSGSGKDVQYGFLAFHTVHSGWVALVGCGAQFGPMMDVTSGQVTGRLVVAEPPDACKSCSIGNSSDSIAIVIRGNCLFVDKVRKCMTAGAKAVLIADTQNGSSIKTNHGFMMSGDQNDEDVSIPSLFLFYQEAQVVISELALSPNLEVVLGFRPEVPELLDSIKALVQADVSDPSQREILSLPYRVLTISLLNLTGTASPEDVSSDPYVRSDISRAAPPSPHLDSIATPRTQQLAPPRADELESTDATAGTNSPDSNTRT